MYPADLLISHDMIISLEREGVRADVGGGGECNPMYLSISEM